MFNNKITSEWRRPG